MAQHTLLLVIFYHEFIQVENHRQIIVTLLLVTLDMDMDMVLSGVRKGNLGFFLKGYTILELLRKDIRYSEQKMHQ